MSEPEYINLDQYNLSTHRDNLVSKHYGTKGGSWFFSFVLYGRTFNSDRYYVSRVAAQKAGEKFVERLARQ